MLFSFKEIKKIANLPESISLNDVVNIINSIGFEVEETIPFGQVEGIKFGRIDKLYKNPNADNLNVCEVVFNDKKRVIQTSATNVYEGMYVVAFVPGSKSGNITFTEKEFKGIMSEGMLSSLNEFQIDKELLRDGSYDGIQEYPEVDLNDDPIEYLGLQDHLIDIDILTNRSDASSYYVMAKEIAANFGIEVKPFVGKKSTYSTKINIEKGYHNELVLFEAKDDFDISLRERVLLAKNKIKSFNNIVDLTNLTLIMTGKPTHAYDKNKVGKTFSSKYFDEKVTVFGEKEVQLRNNLVITSDNKPISIAGVIGMSTTGIENNSKDFVIEFGNFPIKAMRNSLKTVKLSTNAGNQSARKLSIGTTQLAINYITSKLNNFSNIVNFNYKEPKEIDFSIESVKSLAGIDIEKNPNYERAIKVLTTLGFVFHSNKVEIPNYRHDIEHQQDLNEEIFRIFGYSNFPLIAPKISPLKVQSITSLKDSCSAMGYDEAITYTLTSKENNNINIFEFDKDVKLSTYLSEAREVIRNSQLLGLLEVLDYNEKRNIDNISLFSQGMINDGFYTIAFASNKKTFFELKQDIVNLIPNESKFIRYKGNQMHPGVSAHIILNDEIIGVIGKVNPIINNIDAWVAEIKVDALKSKSIQFKNYDQSPLKFRDITFELKEKDEIDAHIKNIECIEKRIIDIYHLDGVRKITVRLFATDEQIKNIDKKYNYKIGL